MGIIRVYKAFKGITDRYEASFECAKPLAPTLDFIRKYQGNGLYRAGKLRVAKDVDMGSWHVIEMQVQARGVATGTVLNVLESIVYQVFYHRDVAYKISVSLRAVDPIKTFNEFKSALDSKIETVKAEPIPVVKEEKVDLSGMSMVEMLDVFDKSVKAFGANVSRQSFEKVKAVKAEIENKIEELPIKERAAYTACMSKVDTFVNAINTQFNNPAMAASVANFAGTYVSQMRAEIANMAAITE